MSGASITLNLSALRRLVDVTTGASDSAVTLPTSGVRDGDMLFTRKADTGAGEGQCQFQYGMAVDTRRCRAMDVYQFGVVGARLANLSAAAGISVYGLLHRPPLSRYVYPKLIGAGGGAGSGRKGASGSVRCGGGGGQAGGYSERLFPAGLLGRH